MSFRELCKDFNTNKPFYGTEKGTELLFKLKYTSMQPYQSSNDLLVKFLKENNIEYIATMGVIWFKYHKKWTNIKVQVDRHTNTIEFYYCIY